MSLEFQISDVRLSHTYEDDDDGGDMGRLIIYLFGRMMDGKDICLRVENFEPYFMVKLPENFHDVEKLINYLKYSVEKKTENNPRYRGNLAETLSSYEIVNNYDLYEFKGEESVRFLKFSFYSNLGFQEYVNCFSSKIDGVNEPKPININGTMHIFHLYETKLEAHLRFFHMRNITGSGWVKVHKKNLEKNQYSKCDYSYTVYWTKVNGIPNDDRIAPFVRVAYDIECISCDEGMPQAIRKSDEIIQIGFSVRYGSETVCRKRWIMINGVCDPLEDVHVECHPTEKSTILGFAHWLGKIRPDIITGYNTYGFDDSYIHDRLELIDEITALHLGVSELAPTMSGLFQFLYLGSKLNEEHIYDIDDTEPLAKYNVKELSSSALGENVLRFYDFPGIITIDMLKTIIKDHRLLSYTLDNTAAYFINETILSYDENGIVTKQDAGLEVNSYIQIMIDEGYGTISSLRDGVKYRVSKITKNEKGVHFTTVINRKDIKMLDKHRKKGRKIQWTFAKDDIHHTEINKAYVSKDPERVKNVAAYCIKDVVLVHILMEKLDIVIKNIGMAQVCIVPLSYLFLRGQGIKALSLVAKKCLSLGYVMPFKKTKTVSFEGACVIDPVCGAYLEPIAVLDYNSLYPRSEQERNLSPETRVLDKKYMNLPGFIYREHIIERKDKDGLFIYDKDGKVKTVKHIFCEKIAKEGEARKYGIIPAILEELLSARARINSLMKEEKDKFKRSVLNSLQLAYKITANSLYGQTGSGQSQIRCLDVAETTTYTGRVALKMAAQIVIDNFPGAEIIYGDTDSIFINFHLVDENGKARTDDEARKEAMILGEKAAQLINAHVAKPQNIVFEKVLHPLLLVTKKKYVGILYDKDPMVGSLKAMGIVLKRKDNAPIVKVIAGGIVHDLLYEKSIEKAVDNCKKNLRKLIDGRYSMDKFTVVKRLRNSYKNPDSIAHKVLADRMAIRDPGNKPVSNDPIPYVHILKKIPKGKKVLQGNLIETPEYVKKNNIKLNIAHYLDNQIYTPASQFLELMINKKEVDKLFNAYRAELNATTRGFDDISQYVTGGTFSNADDVKINLDKKNVKVVTQCASIYDFITLNGEQQNKNVKKKKKRGQKAETVDLTQFLL